MPEKQVWLQTPPLNCEISELEAQINFKIQAFDLILLNAGEKKLTALKY